VSAPSFPAALPPRSGPTSTKRRGEERKRERRKGKRGGRKEGGSFLSLVLFTLTTGRKKAKTMEQEKREKGEEVVMGEVQEVECEEKNHK